MAHSSGLCRFLLVLLGLSVAATRAETIGDSLPTLQGENQDTMSGDVSYDVTTKEPIQEVTDCCLTYDHEDSTHSQAVDQVEGVLGLGAITAIVIAVFLGASVLLALIVITLRKFTAS
ncbi:unnamed protein product [Arctogadus glacialis]